MSLTLDLTNKIKSYALGQYEIVKTTIIPEVTDQRLTYGNSGLLGEYTFLFVDIRQSSKLLGKYGNQLAAKILQSFHDINVRIIISNGGAIRSFDGDRVMGVFSGYNKQDNAVKAAMQIKYAIRTILNPILKADIKCGIGIDSGEVLITKVGKGANVNNNDVVFIGKAVNYASHLCNEANNCVIISPETYTKLTHSHLYQNGISMWNILSIPLKTGAKITCYSSNHEKLLV